MPGVRRLHGGRGLSLHGPHRRHGAGRRAPGGALPWGVDRRGAGRAVQPRPEEPHADLRVRPHRGGEPHGQLLLCGGAEAPRRPPAPAGPGLRGPGGRTGQGAHAGPGPGQPGRRPPDVAVPRTGHGGTPRLEPALPSQPDPGQSAVPDWRAHAGGVGRPGPAGAPRPMPRRTGRASPTPASSPSPVGRTAWSRSGPGRPRRPSRASCRRSEPGAAPVATEGPLSKWGEEASPWRFA